jgi:hypothetical protein
MNENDFKDDPDYADCVTPTYDCYEYDELPLSIFQIVMLSRTKMMLIHMTNMLDPM